MKTNIKLKNLRLNSEIDLKQSKLIIGRGSNCDIHIDDELVGHYHSLLTVHADYIEIMDLGSLSGTLVNNSPISNGSLLIGDQLQIGNTVFACIESFDTNAEVTVLDNIQIQKSTVVSTLPQFDYSDNHVLIDDEYCDIIFDNEGFLPVNNNPIEMFTTAQYEELEQDEKIFKTIEENDNNCFWVTTLINGNILSINHYSLSKTIEASPTETNDTIYIPFIDQKINFLHFSENNITTTEIDQFKVISEDHDTKILAFGTFQLIIEIKQAPSKIKGLPLFARNKEFITNSSKIFGSIFLPLLLLLLVDISIKKPEPLKHVATIYKKMKKVESKLNKISSSNANPNMNTGHKQKTNNSMKVASAKKGAKKPTKAKVAKTPKKVATSKAKSIKSFNLKLKSNVKSIFNKVSKVQIDNSRSIASSDSQVTKISNTNLNSTSTSSEIGNMGSDASGSELNSYGAEGLSSKRGVDSSYEQTRTVVLGSIDPELLRKILREYIPQFRHCYQQELVTNDDLQGIIDLNFRITASGKVSNIDISVKDVQFSNKGSGCMSKVLSIIDFPKPKGGGVVDVKQPLNFFSNRKKA